MKVFYKNFIYIIVFLLTSCNITTEPPHTVISGKKIMVIYGKEIRDTSENTVPQDGTYVYWVSDASNDRWKLITFDNYNVGDTLHIGKGLK